jgi:hypothetical protein
MSACASTGINSAAATTPPRMRLAAINKAFLVVLILNSFKIGARVTVDVLWKALRTASGSPIGATSERTPWVGCTA